MSEVTQAERDYINSQLREAAIVIDTAEHEAILKAGDSNFRVASAAVRNWRQFIDSTPEREKVTRAIKELDETLSLVGGSATHAVHVARQFIADAHYKLASSRG